MCRSEISRYNHPCNQFCRNRVVSVGINEITHSDIGTIALALAIVLGKSAGNNKNNYYNEKLININSKVQSRNRGMNMPLRVCTDSSAALKRGKCLLMAQDSSGNACQNELANNTTHEEMQCYISIYIVRQHDYIISELNLCKQPSHTPFPHLYGLSTGRNKSFKNTEKIWEGRQSVGLIGNVISFALLSVRINKTQNYGHKLHSLAYKNALSYHLDRFQCIQLFCIICTPCRT